MPSLFLISHKWLKDPSRTRMKLHELNIHILRKSHDDPSHLSRWFKKQNHKVLVHHFLDGRWGPGWWLWSTSIIFPESALFLFTPPNPHTLPLASPEKRGTWMFLNSKRILKGILTAPCTTAATPSAEIHPIRGGLSGVLLNTLEQACQVRSALDLSTRNIVDCSSIASLFLTRPEWQIRSAEDACLPLECSKAPLPLSSQT